MRAQQVVYGSVVLLSVASLILSSPLAAPLPEPDPSLSISVQLDGQTFIDKVCWFVLCQI